MPDERDENEVVHHDQDDPHHDPADDWDKDDPRRQHDQMAPPAEPCECWCMHCNRTFNSEGIWFQKVIGDPRGFEGFWMCPTPNCSGAGFTFDIFPTDPDHPANAGWHSFDDDEEEWEEDDESDEEEFVEDANASADEPTDYDPAESKYHELDAINADLPDNDLEGEEWKLGLQPGEYPAGPPTPRFQSEESRREWEEEQASYDAPDERPRELDWSDRTDRGDDSIGIDDIPF